MKNDVSIGNIIQKIVSFRNERNWDKFHNGKDLAICLSCESAELLEVFLWKDTEKADIQKIKEELADVLYSAFLIAETYQFDVDEIISQKLKANREKYPINKAKDSNKKYDEL